MISEAKAIARKSGFARRKTAHTSNSANTVRATANLLSYISTLGDNMVVSGYMPIRTEIDVLPAMTSLHKLGHKICVPVIVKSGQPLSFCEWKPGCDMVSGPFGAMVPANGAWSEPNLLIVPLIAFDLQGYRLGYGGGFYDRSLELLRRKGPVCAVGYAYSGQEGSVPIENTDQKLDAMVTETGIQRFNV